MRRVFDHHPPAASTAAGAPRSSIWSLLKCCLNPRVLIGTGIVIGGIALLAPGLLHSVVPYLLYFICPLSMGLMMWTMSRGGGMSGGGMMNGGTSASSGADQAMRIVEMQEQLRQMESRYQTLKAEHSGSDGESRGSEARVQS